jgi:tetratricopeptide (TPR) repeat protein
MRTCVAQAFISVILGAAIPLAAVAVPAGSIVEIKGSGDYRAARSVDWKPAVVNQSVFADDYVRSLHQSYVTLVYADGTQEKIGPNGQMNIRSMAVEGKGKTLLDLQSGRFWFRSKTPPESLEVKTPSATASVRGTEWQVDIGIDGVSILTVYSGEVDFFNEQGRVLVRANEQARAERGRAPIKLDVHVSRERMQWVSAATVDPHQYQEFRAGRAGDLAAIEPMLREGRLADAADAVRRQAESATASAVGLLLQADFDVYAGELDAAIAVLERGASRYPKDARFPAALATISILRDDIGGARAYAARALATEPDSADALVALGDIERHDGRPREAVEAYSLAARAAPDDARGWRGSGVVEGERENVRPARHDLLRALELDDKPGTRAELATIEAAAGNLALARSELRSALEREPSNFVALTALGIVEIKAGDAGAALQALLAATAIEPRFARGHLYLAVAYYQARREEAAMESLRRAQELDGKDPLPHLLMSLIHMDRIEPGDAAKEARQAQLRLPFVKSLNQVADDQKGVANVGSPLAFAGLEGWARSAAYDSYLPFWGASHLFLADRYPGEFDQRAELMQGFIADPIVFGGPNRFHTLVQTPGNYATLQMRASRNDDVALYEPVVTLAGTDMSRFPFAYFAEAIDTHLEPRAAEISARARTITAAAGMKPRYDWGFFAYANYLDVDEDVGPAQGAGVRSTIAGRASRIDLGAHYAPGPQSMFMAKAGFGQENSSENQLGRVSSGSGAIVSALGFSTRPQRVDLLLRQIWIRDSGLELSVGVEAAQLHTPVALQADATPHFEGAPVAQGIVDQNDRDHSAAMYGTARWQRGAFRLEAALAWHHYEKERDINVYTSLAAVHVDESYRRDRADPYFGLTWSEGATGAHGRLGCRRWLRPTSLDTLEPVAVGGMPIEDQLVLAGGNLEQCRAQAEWSSESLFVAVHGGRVEVHNLVSPLDGPLNAHLDITNLDRLRNRALTPLAKADLLEGLPIYSEGVMRRGGAMLEASIVPSLAARMEYLYTDSQNTAANCAGRLVPYLPRHLVAVGATWTPGHRIFVNASAIYRSERFTDEANTGRLLPGWVGQVRVFSETNDKHWSLEAFASDLWRKDASNVYGVIASYRF